MKAPGNEAISASAGAGKTFQLAHRYIRLMACGVPPDRIIALTFSRKAAGEIFDSIVKYMGEAAASHGKAGETGKRIGIEGMSRHAFLSLLRRFVDNLHRIRIGTLDSFIVGVMRAFPMELGVGANLELHDSESAAANTAHREVLARIFNERRAGYAAQSEFINAFKQATFGHEEKDLERVLDEFVEKYRTYYQILPGKESWGAETAVWRSPSPWLKPVENISAVADKFRELVERSDWAGTAKDRWFTFIDAVRGFGADSPWTRDIEYIFEKLAGSMDDLRAGSVSLKLDRQECEMGEKHCELALECFAHVMAVEIGRALKQTRGIYRVLDQYERIYDAIRRSGRMTFSDVQQLLTSANSRSRGAVLSRSSGMDGKLYIDYRLDCRLDHWLLDEFQDTSDLQWNVLANLADEVIQDDSGRRSFFYVGDVKQAIYGWRGGNARLFGEILKAYGSSISQVRMNVSYRSCRPVIDTVNKVFLNLPSELPDGTVSAWESIWRPHECKVHGNGYAAILEPAPSKEEEGEDKPTEEDRYSLAVSILREIDPLKRGLTVALLVRTNKAGKDIVDFIRSECPEMPVVHEGRAAIRDNPVVSVLLALVKLAAHPGDTYAWRHLQMSPLYAALKKLKLDRDSLSLHLLREIHASGFRGLIEQWGRRLDDKHAIDAFGGKRLDDLIEAAGEFDNTGSLDCGGFLNFIDGYEIDEPASDKSIRVMTVHQAKGLGFDVVILPELMGGGITGAGQPGLVMDHDSGIGMPRWALKMPRRIVAENDPVLAGTLRACDENACFDELCVLYVAMTRARRGLYMITSYPGRTAKAINPAALLKIQLAGDMKPVKGAPVKGAGERAFCLYECGDRSWYSKILPAAEKEEAEPSRELPKDFKSRKSVRVRLVHVEPSAQEQYITRASWLFDAENRDVLSFGGAIHQLLKMVEWMDSADAEQIISKWLAVSPDAAEVRKDVCEQFRCVLACDEVRKLLSRPGGNVELWREKRFEIVLASQLVAGVFDRVTIVRDDGGRPLRADVLDYKSDRIGSEPEFSEAVRRYRPQLTLYGLALSRILNLAASKIRARLLFTRSGRVCEVGGNHRLLG